MFVSFLVFDGQGKFYKVRSALGKIVGLFKFQVQGEVVPIARRVHSNSPANWKTNQCFIESGNKIQSNNSVDNV